MQPPPVAVEILNKKSIAMRFWSLTAILRFMTMGYAFCLLAIIFLLALMMLAICSVYLQMSLAKALH